MRIAIPNDGGAVAEHFGQARSFRIYEAENGAVVKAEDAECDAMAHDTIAIWLLQNFVDTVVCGNIGPTMQGMVAVAGIRLFAGVGGECDRAVEDLLAGKLEAADGGASHCGGGCNGGRCCSGGCCSTK